MVKELKTKTAKAKARAIRVSPQKLNLVAASIRGLKADKALTQLSFSHKRVAEDVKKLVSAAIANAENNHGMDVDRLIVSEAYVGKAMVMKRFRAGAKGRGNRIIKPFSNMTVVVAEADAAPARKEKAPKKAKTRKTAQKAQKQEEKV